MAEVAAAQHLAGVAVCGVREAARVVQSRKAVVGPGGVDGGEHLHRLPVGGCSGWDGQGRYERGKEHRDPYAGHRSPFGWSLSWAYGVSCRARAERAALRWRQSTDSPRAEI